jgi:transposase-like protein
MDEQVKCPKCMTFGKVIKYGKYKSKQRYRCTHIDDAGEKCGYVFSSEKLKGKSDRSFATGGA